MAATKYISQETFEYLLQIKTVNTLNYLLY